MLTYISAFIFYTLAMMGVLFVGFIIYKKTFLMNKTGSTGGIKIIDSLAIGPKKMLFVIKVKNERFLIASGDTHTTFLSKLEGYEENESLASAILEAQANNYIADNDSHNQIKQTQSQQNIYTQNYIPQEAVYRNPSLNNYQNRTEYDNIPLEEQIFPEENERMRQIQRQFKTLYSRDSKTSSVLDKTQTQAQDSKRAAIKKLLRDLNEAASSTKGGF